MNKLLLSGTFILCAGVLSAAPRPIAELDFSRAENGKIIHKNAAAQSSLIQTLSPYGRFRGISAEKETGKTYPQNALDRKGEWKAMRFGSAKEYFQIPNFTPETGKPFTIETWLFIYDPGTYFDGMIMDAGFGYKTGFRLTVGKAKWAPNGLISIACGDGKTSKFIFAKNTNLNVWHHLVITSTGDSLAFYLDGIPAKAERPEETPEKFLFEKNTPLLFGGSPRGGTDFKTDFLAVSDKAMSADEAKQRYEAGKAAPDMNREKLFAAIKLEIPKESQGYFKTGEKIPVSISVPSELKADQITVNGKKYGLKDRILLDFGNPGIYNIDIAISAGGKVLRSTSWPIAVIPAPKNRAKTGSSSIVTKTPASYALASRLSREVVSWPELEPKKGEYNWTGIDRIMKINREKGMATVLCLTGIPDWAKIPENIENYKKMLGLLLARYDVKFIEIWNAQGSPWSHCKPEIYKQLLAAAATTAKQEDESIKILAGRFVPGREGYWKLLHEIPGSYDIISVDFNPQNAEDKNLSVLCSNKDKKPVWVIGGYPQQTPGSPENRWIKNEKESASAEIRSMIHAFSEGAKEWFAESGPDEYTPAPNESDGRPGWKGVAYAVFHSMIGKDATLKSVPAQNGLTAYRYENPDKTSGLIVFSEKGTKNIEVSTDAVGLFGEKLGKGKITINQIPVYLPGSSKI